MRKCSLHVYLWMLLALGSLSGCHGFSHPSDESLIERFHSEQADFEKLVAMLSEDRNLVRLTGDYVSYRNYATPLPNERLVEYRRLLKSLMLSDGVSRSPDGFQLVASSRGMVLASSAKSYSYSLKEPAPIVDSLDAVIKQNRGDQQPIWRRISGNWYLSYESW